jgi:hypothetical protein
LATNDNPNKIAVLTSVLVYISYKTRSEKINFNLIAPVLHPAHFLEPTSNLEVF